MIESSTMSPTRAAPPSGYRYDCDDRSLLLPALKSWICRPLFRFIPPECPANFLTLAGNLAVLAAFVLSLRAAETTAVRSLVIPFLLLAYLVLDHLDGMQAVASGTNNPLGELLDHGFDAFNSGLIFLILADAFDARRRGLAAAALGAIYLAQALTFDEQLRTGRIIFEKLGSVEAIVGLALLLALSGFAPALSALRLGLDAVLAGALLGGAATCLTILRRAGAPSARFLLPAAALALFAASVLRLELPLWRQSALMTLFGGTWVLWIILARLTGRRPHAGEILAAAAAAALGLRAVPDERILWLLPGLGFAAALTAAARGFSRFWAWKNPVSEMERPAWTAAAR
jgi:phosphatidylglycerophosphate synthase